MKPLSREDPCTCASRAHILFMIVASDQVQMKPDQIPRSQSKIEVLQGQVEVQSKNMKIDSKQ
eukprot:1451788-Karenia_brevis.AAC.2